MESKVVAALEVGDYKAATQLLRQWQSKEPTSPLLRLYAATLQEQTGRLESAEKNYVKLLKQAAGGKITSKARAGLQRIQQSREAQKAQSLQKARSVKGGTEPAVMAIAPPRPEHRQEAIATFANLFKLDAYTARLKIPTEGIRLYRVAPWGDISYYAQQLKTAKLPTVCTKISQIKSLQVFQVCYFERLGGKPSDTQLTVVCKNADGQFGTLSFDWAEVRQRVVGQLPIFEQVIDLGPMGRPVHKEKVQDYAQVVDLHLPGREISLRLCDRFYQYKKGVSLTNKGEVNSRIQWNQLLTQINSSVNGVRHDGFERFGKGALEFVPLLGAIAPNLDIDRRAPSDWDIAFHLYSSLLYDCLSKIKSVA